MANAIEMAVMAMAKKMMEGLEARIPELISGLPPDVFDGARQTMANVASFKAQLDRIENQQRLIMAHLKIPDDTIPAVIDGSKPGETNDGLAE